MKLKKPKFWDYKNPNIFAYFLFPFSLILSLLNYIQNKFILKKNMNKNDGVYKICIGNIYVGGTGKTPISIEINKILRGLKFKTAFVKKNYSDQIDEQKLLSSNGTLFCEKNRILAIEKAIKNDIKALIFDDGLQDINLKNIYNLSVVCFNTQCGIGNGLLLPAGPLRESLQNLKKYHVVFLNGNGEDTSNIQNIIKNINPKIKIFEATYLVDNLKTFDLSKDYIIFSGIGNPKSFLRTLKKNNFNIIKDLSFPDHYNYSNNDIIKIKNLAKKYDAKILTTEKDYNRLEKNNEDIEFLKIKLNINNKNELINFLHKKI